MGRKKTEIGPARSAIRDVFRRYGFEGASLTRLAQATGLQRASLYHHFPGGKDGMAIAAIDDVADLLKRELFTVLEGDDAWRARLQDMCRQLDAYYCGGRTPCLLAAFSFGAVPGPARQKAKRLLSQWQDKLSALVVDAGQTEERARAIAEQILVEIQGGLIVASLTQDVSPFQRTLERLPALIESARD